jgi:hypothetical protein
VTRDAPQQRDTESAEKEVGDDSRGEEEGKKRRQAARDGRRREQKDARSNRPIGPERGMQVSDGLVLLDQSHQRAPLNRSVRFLAVALDLRI